MADAEQCHPAITTRAFLSSTGKHIHMMCFAEQRSSRHCHISIFDEYSEASGWQCHQNELSYTETCQLFFFQAGSYHLPLEVREEICFVVILVNDPLKYTQCHTNNWHAMHSCERLEVVFLLFILKMSHSERVQESQMLVLGHVLQI